MPFEPIAILGSSCILPGAHSPDALWENLVAGRKAIGPVPAGRWDLPVERALQATRSERECVSSDAGGYVEGFSAELPENAQLEPELWTKLDPLFQWALHGTHQALHPLGHSGYSDRAGLILGNLSFPSRAMAHYAERQWLASLGSRLQGNAEPWAGVPEVAAENRFMSSGPAGLTAKALGLGAGSLTLDAACASALYAIKIACDWLHQGRADVMVAGAVNGADSLFIHMGFSALSAMSPTGQSRPFDQRADGLVPAEGAGFLTLKRLRDAVSNGDEILGVIRGLGLSNDGRGRGLLVPDEGGQLRAMQEAYKRSGLTPADIQFVECHATGTALGDSTELRSMARLFGSDAKLPIGSLKSNLGHLITAAGIGATLKVLKGMACGQLPPMPAVEHPVAELSAGPFRVATAAEPWTCRTIRRAAVNAFGFGGNNAHLLLEQWTGSDPTAPAMHAVPAQLQPEIAVVGMCALMGDDQSPNDFAQRLFSSATERSQRGEVAVALRGLRFPPKDIQQTLPQQTLVLEAARKAVQGITLPRERSGVFIGMETDPQVARYGMRWQLEVWAERWAKASGRALSEAWTQEAQDRTQHRLESASVLGTMPNIVANRINSQLDLAGASMTLSTGELSGVAGLQVAIAALQQDELDAAVVGAVDLSDELVHRCARHELGQQGPVADGTAVLVLKRLADAQRDGDPVLAIFAEPPQASLLLGSATGETDPLPGHGQAFAAAGLLQVAAGVTAVHHGMQAPAATGRARRQPWFGPRNVRVTTENIYGDRAVLNLRSDRQPAGLRPAHAPRLRCVSGANRAEVLRNLDRENESNHGPARLVWLDYGDQDSAQRSQRARYFLANGGQLPEYVAYQEKPIQGDLAFVFTGAAAAYAGMGSDLLLAMPEAYTDFVQQLGPNEAATEALSRGFSVPSHPLDQLWASSLLCQAHAWVSRHLLGLQPQAVIGYSSGESNGMFALGAWRDLGQMFLETMEQPLLNTELAGPFHAAERAWRKHGWQGERAVFKTYAVPCNEATVLAALVDEPLVHLTIVNSPGDCVIGGEESACRRVLQKLGADSAMAIPYKLIAHAPELAEAQNAWLAMHSRLTWQVPGVRYYWNGFGEARELSQDTVAQAITLQAIQALHFPRVIERAYADGVRVFVEHGPQSLCSRWIGRILGNREHLAVALDSTSRSALQQLAWTSAQLMAAGCPLRAEALVDRLTAGETRSVQEQTIVIPAHPPSFDLPTIAGETQRLPLAPALPAVLEPGLFDRSAPPRPPTHQKTQPQLINTAIPSTGAVRTYITEHQGAAAINLGPQDSQSPPTADGEALCPRSPSPYQAAQDHAQDPGHLGAPTADLQLRPSTSSLTRRAQHAAQVQGSLAGVHQDFLLAQAQTQQAFLALQQRMTADLLARAGAPQSPARPVSLLRQPPLRPQPPLAARSQPALPQPAVVLPHAAQTPSPTSREAAPEPGSRPTGPTFGRAELLVHASGTISSIFGREFAAQDVYERQVRMPEPPLLLVDRVTGIRGAAGSMGTGTIWTETDVVEDAWYMQDGRMPAGIMIEAGQADLMLISWLGVDRFNQGKRVYRLLGSELTYHGELPRVGETLRYEIHIDGHAQQGDTRLFFFHYDCWAGERRVMSVRSAQAGFFSYEELAESAGVLWDPKEDTRELRNPHALPAVHCTRAAFDQTALTAFAEGRVFECFGPGFELAQTHVDPPRIAQGRMLLLDRVTDLDVNGGPWQRGYLRAELDIQADAWFFAGHFKNDPCMPGTLMFEGCLQTMAFFLTALGFTLERDGYQFEPMAECSSTMRCRGQVSPHSQRLVYEVFVEEVQAGDVPHLRADLLCTVDGLKAFHARSFTLQLKPSWPLERWKNEPALVQVRGGGHPYSLRKLGGLADYSEPKAVASHDGFEFGYASLLACAWGRPTTAFGPFYERFDSARRVARLPGPPYHFATRVVEIGATMGEMKGGSQVDIEYDIPAEVWYFEDNGAATMPLCVIMEASLQPCGWLASYIGSTLATETDLMFRNLDGTATLHEELLPTSGSLRTRARINTISRSGTMIIESFRVECYLSDRLVYEMDTVFGFFPKEAFENQTGLPVSDEARNRIEGPGQRHVDLRGRPARYFTGSLRIAGGRLCMLDRITDHQPTGGLHGLGWARAEKAVDPGEWFFKAHFFQDPVQPGSLGVEAMCQLLQFVMIEQGLDQGIHNPQFEPLALGRALKWKYRGQVVPQNRCITTEVEVTAVEHDEQGCVAVADAALWVDGKRIYQATGLAMRIRPGQPSLDPDRDRGTIEETLNPEADHWLADHCPTWTLPALPMMSMVDRLAAAAHAATGREVVGLEDVQVHRWLTFPGGPTRLQTCVKEQPTATSANVELSAWREAKTQAMSRFERVASGRVKLRSGDEPPPPAPWPQLATGELVAAPYDDGSLFHGPRFQMLRSLRISDTGASAELAVDADGVPPGHLRQGLLDALTHAIPHDALFRWSERIAQGQVGYPYRIPQLQLFGPLPSHGRAQLEVRFAGFDGSERFPMCELQLQVDNEVRLTMTLVEVLLPTGPIGQAPATARRAFLRDGHYVEGVGLSHGEQGMTCLKVEDVQLSNWLPGNVARIYDAPDTAELPRHVAIKDHIAQLARVHPATVQVAPSGDSAQTAHWPFHRFPVEVHAAGKDEVRVSSSAPTTLDLTPVREFWRQHFGLGTWPVEDLYYALVELFLGRVVLTNPEEFNAIQGRGALYLANHQVGIESLLFSIVMPALSGSISQTLAKTEHQQSWLGGLIRHCFAFPGVQDPGTISFFDRDDPANLPQILHALGQDLLVHGKSTLIHVEGTRALSCRRPITKLSGTVIDMALAVGCPIVPVRFAGALPVEPLSTRREFPVGYGRQDLYIGAPLAAADLQRRPLKERREYVLQALNELGPDLHQEVPNPSAAEVEAEVQSWCAQTGAQTADAALLVALTRRPPESDLMQRLVLGMQSGRLELGSTSGESWLAALARQLYGPQGPTVVQHT